MASSNVGDLSGPAWQTLVPPGLDLGSIAARLVTVGGVVGMVLGGSRARGERHDGSDVDLGIYYRGDLDVAALAAIARDVGGPDAEVTEPGGWGRWVDGGGWLVVDGIHVDWLYRDVDRVREAWTSAHRGTYAWNVQVGHPLGVPDFAYVGELALGRVLADPAGELTDLRDASIYPDALATALVQNLWEAEFLVTPPKRRAEATRHTSPCASAGPCCSVPTRCTATTVAGSSTRRGPSPPPAGCPVPRWNSPGAPRTSSVGWASAPTIWTMT